MRLLKILAIVMFVLMVRPIATPTVCYLEHTVKIPPEVFEEVPREVFEEVPPEVFEEVTPITPQELGYEDFDEAVEELDLLARVVYGEARGESFEGKLAVASVVMNRLEDSRFGDTLEEVVYQRGQFDCVTQKDWEEWQPDAECYKAAQQVLAGHRSLPPDIIFFHNPKTSTDRSQVNRVRVYKTIGNHAFGK